MSTHDTFIVRARQAEESTLERTTAWAIVVATCLVTLLGPFFMS